MPETLNICEKCKKQFASKDTLKVHVRTAKCEKVTIIHFCSACDKVFSSKQMLTYHLSICSAVKCKEIIDEYEEKIKYLEERLAKCTCKGVLPL